MNKQELKKVAIIAAATCIPIAVFYYLNKTGKLDNLKHKLKQYRKGT